MASLAHVFAEDATNLEDMFPYCLPQFLERLNQVWREFPYTSSSLPFGCCMEENFGSPSEICHQVQILLAASLKRGLVPAAMIPLCRCGRQRPLQTLAVIGDAGTLLASGLVGACG